MALAREQITIVDLHDGVDGSTYSLNILGGTRTISYNATGKSPTPAQTAYSCELYKDGVEVTPSSYAWSASGHLSGTSTTAGFTPTALPTYNASLTSSNVVSLTVAYKGMVFKGTVQVVVTKAATDAKLITLVANSQVFKVVGKTVSPTTTKITAETQNTSVTAWTYSTNGAAFTSTLPAGVTRSGSTVTITGAGMTAQTIAVKASDGTYSDVMTIVKVADGGEGKPGAPAVQPVTGFLTNESVTFPADFQGNVTGHTGPVGSFKVFQGATDVTASADFTASNNVGGTVSISDTGVYTLNSLTADRASVDLTAVYGGVSIVKTLTISKSRAGAPGRAVDKIDVMYYSSTSPTTQENGSWSTNAPAWVNGRFIWSKTVTTYSEGTPPTTSSLPILLTGATGNTGRGVKSITEQYALTSNKDTAPSQGSSLWKDVAPTWTKGSYMWTRSKIIYLNSDGSETTTYVGVSVDTAWEAVNEVEEDIEERLVSHDARIDTNEREIALRATKQEVNAIDTRVSAAEVKVEAGSIVSTVRKSTEYVDDQGKKVSTNEIISKINQSAEEIKIQASKVNIQGAVTFSSFDSNLQDELNSKARTFTSTPVPPYSLGDIWKNSASTYMCKVARATGSYVAADWEKTGDVTGSNTAADTAKVNGTDASTVKAGAAAGSAAKTATDRWTYTGKTTIDGGEIETDTVTAAQIKANTITANEIAANTITVDQLASSVGSSLNLSSNTSIISRVESVVTEQVEAAPIYTWIKYATNAQGSGITDDPTGKTYIGIASGQTTATESDDPTAYTWSKIEGPQGEQGIEGPSGKDGTPRYTWIKYADTATGSGMNDSPTGKRFLGLAHNKTTATESTNPADYQWSPLYDNVQVGGRNLWLNSFGTALNHYPGTYHITGNKAVLQDTTLPTKNYMSITNFAIAGVSPSFYFTPTSNAYFSESIAGQNVMVSFYLRGNVPFKFDNRADIGTSWTKVSFPYTFGSSNAHFYIREASLTTLDISSIKIEKGTIATDWTPAPEDIEAEMDALAGEIGDVNQAVTDLDGYVDGAFKDGVISEAEAKAIEKYLNIVNTEKADVDAKYTKLYANALLAGAAKTDLLAKKNLYNTAHTNLISAINTAISDGKATTAEKTNVDTKFTAYRTALTNLSTAFEVASAYLVDAVNGRFDGPTGVLKRITTVEDKVTDDAIISTVSEKTTSDGKPLFAKTSEVKQTVDEWTATFSQVGARNLLLASGVTVTNSNYPTQEYLLTKPLVVGETYTYRVKGRLGAGNTGWLIYNEAGVATGPNLADQKVKNGVYYGTFVATRPATAIRVYPNANNSATSTIDWVKLEEGSVATGWTQAPEEYLTGITKITKDGVNVSVSDFAINSQLSYDGLEVRDGEKLISSFSDKGAVIPTLEVDKIISDDVIRVFDGGAFDIGPGKAYTTVSEVIDVEMKGKKYLKRDMNISFYDSVSDDIEIKGFTGPGVIKIIFRQSATLYGQIRVIGTTNEVIISGTGLTGRGTIISNLPLHVSNSNRVYMYYMNLKAGAYGVYAYDGSNVDLASIDVTATTAMVNCETGSRVTSRQNIGNVKYAFRVATSGIIFAMRERPKASSGNVILNSGGFFIDDGGTETISAFVPPAVTSKTFTQKFTVATFQTKSNDTYVSSQYGASAAQNRWPGMSIWTRGYITLGTGIDTFVTGATSKSAKMRLRRKNSSHGDGGAVVPTPRNFTCTMSGASRGGWTGWGAIPTASIGDGKVLTLGSNTTSNYAIWDAIEIEVTVTKNV